MGDGDDTPSDCKLSVPTNRPITLPPEILLQVFAHASVIPGAYTHSDRDAFTAFTLDSFGINVHRRHHDATRTMLAASGVCKLWASLAVEFLYKYILIKSGAHAVEVAATLERDARRSPNGSLGSGRWTVRLELALQGVHIWTEAHTLAFRRILASCPNLTVCSTVFSDNEPRARLYEEEAFLDATLAVAECKTVRRLELLGSILHLTAVLPRLSAALPLEALWLLPLNTKDVRPLPELTLPFLRALSIYTALPVAIWTTPLLETLQIQGMETKHLQRYLRERGAQLRHLHVGYLSYPISSFCPSLIECTLQYTGPNDGLADLLTTTPLRRVTLCGCPLTATGPIPQLLEWVLKNRDGGKLPSLEIVRFMVAGGVCLGPKHLAFCGCDAVAKPAWGCVDRGIRVELSYGDREWTANTWRPYSDYRVAYGK